MYFTLPIFIQSSRFRFLIRRCPLLTDEKSRPFFKYQVKSSQHYLFSTFYNRHCLKATVQNTAPTDTETFIEQAEGDHSMHWQNDRKNIVSTLIAMCHIYAHGTPTAQVPYT